MKFSFKTPSKEDGFLSAKSALVAGVVLAGAAGGGAVMSSIAQNSSMSQPGASTDSSNICVVAAYADDDEIIARRGNCEGLGGPVNPGGTDGPGSTPIGDVVYESDPNPSNVMLTTWDTSKSGCATITLPMAGYGEADSPPEYVDGEVDWGDGTVDTLTLWDNRHTYTDLGIKQVKVTGEFSAFGAWGYANDCLISVDEWGDGTKTKNLYQAFQGAQSLKSVKEIPNTVTEMGGMFYDSNFNGPVNHFDTSNVTSMREIFFYNSNFNQPVDNWDVSKVTDMSNMFAFATSFNQPLNDWEVSEVVSMHNLFRDAKLFDQPLNKWDTKSLTEAAGMFSGASSFKQPLNTWDTSKLKIAYDMFRNATAFNQDISNWNLDSAIDLRSFYEGSGLTIDQVPEKAKNS